MMSCSMGNEFSLTFECMCNAHTLIGRVQIARFRLFYQKKLKVSLGMCVFSSSTYFTLCVYVSQSSIGRMKNETYEKLIISDHI